MILQNIDKINRQNIKIQPFEHLIVEDFVTGLDNECMFENYLSTCKDISGDNHPANGPRYVNDYYDIEKLIQEKQNQICELVNNVWKCNVDQIKPVTNMISKGQNLTIHNDYDIENIHYMPPVRGIIYCNPKYTFGTNIYGHDSNNECVKETMQTVGGNPGELFLFRVTKNSWHSAFNTENKSHRLIVSLKFINTNEYNRLSGNFI